jgi:hypothetical protein
MRFRPVPPHQMSYPPGRLTRMSQPKVSEALHFRHLSRLAWASLCLLAVAALGGPSCLVTTSPEFAQPVQTPPFLTNLSPNPYQIQTIRSAQGATTGYEPAGPITFDVVSEDLQSPPLQAALLLDFQGLGVPYDIPALAVNRNIPAGHLPAPRHVDAMSFGLSPSVTKGCHSVTLIVTHEFASDPFQQRKINPKKEGDVATVTWWYQVGDLANPSLDITTCTVATGDAGADASEAGGS